MRKTRSAVRLDQYRNCETRNKWKTNKKKKNLFNAAWNGDIYIKKKKKKY